MTFKYIIIALSALCSTFAVSGINFDHFIKSNHIWEARFLSVLLILALTYLVSSFMFFLGTI